MKRKKIDITLFDDYHHLYTYKDYLENCKDNGIEPQGENSEDYYDWLYDMERIDWEDLEENLKYSEHNGKCVICGALGLWNGRREIEPVLMDDIFSAIKKCVGRCDYTIIKLTGGHIEVQGIHHDGTNSFEIHILNERGLRAGEKADLNNRCYHKILKDYLF